jgi:hypothetical protein
LDRNQLSWKLREVGKDLVAMFVELYMPCGFMQIPNVTVVCGQSLSLCSIDEDKGCGCTAKLRSGEKRSGRRKTWTF